MQVIQPTMDAKVFILCALAVAAAGEVVNVTTSKSLEQYLCPPTRTIPPNTDVIISVPSLQLTHPDGQFCLIENTTNITISASQELMNSKTEVVCMNDTGFGFFNITNLTVRSVYFQNCENTVPPMAVRYANESNQFLYYDNVRSTLIFNHCCDLTLSQIFFAIDQGISIIGVNLCGASNIHLLDENHYDLLSDQLLVLMYYMDSPITPLISEYQLNIRSNMIGTSDIENTLATKPDRIPVSSVARGFGLYLTQQLFDVNATLDIDKWLEIPDKKAYVFTLFFVNSLTDSLVTFQSNSNKLCDDSSVNPIVLEIVFYETSSLQSNLSTISSPIIVRNVAFSGVNSYDSSIVNIRKFSRKLSHQVILENVSWCYNTLSGLLHAQGFDRGQETGVIHLSMVNISMHHCSSSFAINTDSFINLIGIENVSMSGVNYFAHNMEGSVINLASSKLYATGDLTIANGYAYHGGAIRLDSGSTLFLQEPLVARFYNNSATEGNAIYALGNAQMESGIQIWPSKAYSLDNITDIDIHLHFSNNTYNGNTQRSLYAPYFSLFGQQTSPNLLFSKNDWLSDCLAYTTLIESTITYMHDLDKYSSLDNGVCIQEYDRPPWKCMYIDSTFAPRIFPTPASGVLVVIDAYPGQKALSILNMDDNVYSVHSVKDDSTLNQTFWNATMISTTLTKYVRFEFYHLSQIMLIVLTNSVLSVPIIEVGMLDCPVGFNLTDSGRCDCIVPLLDHGYKCDINTRTFTNPSGYWTGFSNKSIISFSTHCPPGYCNLNTHQEFVLNNSLSDLYCNDNRTGTLCGKCKTNYSSVFGSDECHSHCSNLYLLTIPVYGVAGLILVVALFALRLTVATGTINGVIFYANVMGLVMRILIGEHPQVHFRIFHIIISLLNLELGFPICFYSEMTPAAKVGLQFVFPVYVWSLVLLLVLLSKYSVKLTNLIMNSSVQVLATLFYLSFAKILRNAIDIVSYSSLQSIAYVPDIYGNWHYQNLTEKTVWFYDGSDYAQGIHGFYLCLAVLFCILFLLPYGVFSLGFTCSCRPFNKMRFSLKPFRDAYCGPFKDKWRFWFGLRLWVTALLYAISGGLQGHDPNAMFLVHFFVIGALTFLQALIRPFRNYFITLLDTFFMLNYWLVVEFYLLSKIPGFQGFPGVYTFLLSSAILVLCLILVGHVCFLKYPNFLATIRDKVNRRRDGYVQIQQGDSDADQQLFQAAEERDPIVDTY